MPIPAGVNEELDRRRVVFGRFVERVYKAAKSRGMTAADIRQATITEATPKGLATSTIYAWINGEWDKDPMPHKVHAFCDGLSASRDEAYRALGWTLPGARRRAEPEPIEDELLRRLGRALNDPNVSPPVKLFLRRQLRLALDSLEPEE